MKRKIIILASAALVCLSTPLFALDNGTIVNVPVTVTDTNGNVLQGKHVDATDSSNNVQVHAVRLQGTSNLKWKIIAPVDSSNPATATVQVRIGGDKSPEMVCTPDVSLLSKDGSTQLTKVTYVVDMTKNTCQTTPTYANANNANNVNASQ